MRVAPRWLLVAVFLVSAGCSGLGKKSAAPSLGPNRSPVDGRPLGHAGPPATSPSADPPVQAAAYSGVLAGQVIDAANARPEGVFIQVSDRGDSPGAPIEVPADGQGYFAIPGLQPGRPYQLTARVRSGDRILAGTTIATPPNPRVLIRIGDGFVPTPPPDGAVAAVQPPTAAPAPDRAPPDGAPRHGAWRDTNPPAASPERAAQLGAPVAVPPAAPRGAENPAAPHEARPPRPEFRPQDTAQGMASRDRGDRMLEIPGPGSGPPAAPFSWDSPPPRSPDLLAGPARVPSCVLTGQKLENFALPDLNGQPWEFRQHHGKLILLDFWGTWCLPCQHAVPHLKDLQLRYGPYGLEVVGIAYEEGNLQEQIQKVTRVRNRLGINYRLLLGSDRAQCPVRNQFQIRNWPTFVLLDGRGTIVYRGEGVDAAQLRELEIIVRQQLGLR